MVHTHAGQAYAPQPPLDDFAAVLKTISSGNKFFPDRPATLTETPTKIVTKVGWQQIFFNMFLKISVGIASLFSLFQWLSATLFTMFPKKPRKTCNKPPPRRQHSIFLQGVCPHDPFTTGAVIGKCAAKSTRWYSFRPNRRMEEHVDNNSIFGQKRTCWIAIVGHHFKFIKSLRYNKLGKVVKSFCIDKKNQSIH